jgi:hypothetical protein
LVKWQDNSRVDDVVNALKDAESQYKGKLTGKTWKWASKLSSCIMFYSQVLDALAQHHPEYVALVWGTLKFLLVVSGPAIV